MIEIISNEIGSFGLVISILLLIISVQIYSDKEKNKIKKEIAIVFLFLLSIYCSKQWQKHTIDQRIEALEARLK